MSDYKGPGTGAVDTYTPDNLLAGDFPLVSFDIEIEEGQDLSRGAVIGVDSYRVGKLSLAAGDDGSEVPYGILAQDADASDAAVTAPVYVSGVFNERALTLGAGHTADSIRDGLRDRSVFIKSSVKAGV